MWSVHENGKIAELYKNKMLIMKCVAEKKKHFSPSPLHVSTMTIISDIEFKDSDDPVYIDIDLVKRYMKQRDRTCDEGIVDIGNKERETNLMNEKERLEKDIIRLEENKVGCVWNEKKEIWVISEKEKVTNGVRTTAIDFFENEIKEINRKINSMKFYNQVSIRVKISSIEEINMKIFRNGRLQMTGCKTEESAKRAVEIVCDNLMKTRGILEVPLVRENGLLISRLDKIYADDGEYIGYYENERRSKNVRNHTRKLMVFDSDIQTFIWCYHEEVMPGKYLYLWITYSPDLEKNIYDSNGNKIGYQKIIFHEEFKDYNNFKYVNKANFLYSKNKNGKRIKLIIQQKSGDVYKCFEELVVVTKQSDTIGRVEMKIHGVEIKSKEDFMQVYDKIDTAVEGEKTKVVSNYSAVRCGPDKKLVLKGIKIGMINTDYTVGYNINRIELNRLMIDEYKQTSSFNGDYPGVKIRFYMKINSKDYNCSCVEKKCNCVRISVMCFQSGCVIITGAKSMNQVNTVYNFMNHVFESKEDVIKKQIFSL